NASHYHTGDQFHLDVALAKHMPLLGGDFAVGATGYYYEQFTRDRGSGVRLPKPEGRASGIGPVFTYSRKLGNVDTAVEFKWLPDITTNNRLNGDAFWLKLEFNF
ncbi:MAG: protein involved in meta-pathway of phenol degradation, partial [Phycisphaerales bacterium]|nr:protein involved in meta-pathway of phenol degradation [Phycisphaerales bacterium]